MILLFIENSRLCIVIRGRLIERVECEILLRDRMNVTVCCVLIYIFFYFEDFEAFFLFLSYLN